ncbi:DUF6542 domain-containing protein [Streptomyces sp. INA 01156]
MLTLGFLVALLFGSVQTVYGVLFLPVCVLTALWVREEDLLTAPVIVPIAFALGLLPLVDDGGSGGWLMGMVTGLATQAGWLYGAPSSPVRSCSAGGCGRSAYSTAGPPPPAADSGPELLRA